MKKTLIYNLLTAAIAMAGLQAAENPQLFDETKDTITLFSFDDVSIPYTENLKLEMRTPERHEKTPVVTRGAEGEIDSWAVQFYGSVLRDHETGKFRMWYVAVSKEERKNETEAPSKPWRVAYAESDDGISWTKPDLGDGEHVGNLHGLHGEFWRCHKRERHPVRGAVEVVVPLLPDSAHPKQHGPGGIQSLADSDLAVAHCVRDYRFRRL
ncbi:hypothetical protein OAK81_02045 [Verrucomicrobiales bacterium]|nr:hypothetical protein [Verrucomicrobiales bacterium]